MKWNRIDLELVSQRTPTDADDEVFENQSRDDVRTVAERFDKVSELLTGQPFDSFLSQHNGPLQLFHAKYPASKNANSPKDFFIKELFHRRNKIVHSGQIDFQQANAEICLTLAMTLSEILKAMD